jgi:hypothetical protein
VAKSVQTHAKKHGAVLLRPHFCEVWVYSHPLRRGSIFESRVWSALRSLSLKCWSSKQVEEYHIKEEMRTTRSSLNPGGRGAEPKQLTEASESQGEDIEATLGRITNGIHRSLLAWCYTAILFASYCISILHRNHECTVKRSYLPWSWLWYNVHVFYYNTVHQSSDGAVKQPIWSSTIPLLP